MICFRLIKGYMYYPTLNLANVMILCPRSELLDPVLCILIPFVIPLNIDLENIIILCT